MKPLRIFSLLLVLALGIHSLSAQEEENRRGDRGGRRNWAPAQFQQRMLERVKEDLAASEEEWTAISPLISAVMEKQRDARTLTSRGGRRWGNQESAPEIKALEEALAGGDAKTIRVALENLRKARLAKEAAIDEAQKALQEVLTVTQEAKLTMSGTLD